MANKTATINWALPTTYTDDFPLDVLDIKHVLVEMSVDGGVSFGEIALVVPGAEPLVQQAMSPGEYSFSFQIVLNDGRISDVAFETILIPTDAAPNNITNIVITIA